MKPLLLLILISGMVLFQFLCLIGTWLTHQWALVIVNVLVICTLHVYNMSYAINEYREHRRFKKVTAKWRPQSSK